MRATRQVVDRASEFLRAHAGEGVRIGEVSRDQCAQAKALVQLARQQQSGVGGYRRPVELDTKLGVEREANRARFCVTHWMMPSATREATVTRIASQYGFFELGRFAGIYKNAFGESPSQTIRVRRTSRNASSC